jgi:hypothetical protein
MRCDELEPLIEAFADGTVDPSPEDRAHLATCAVCAPRIEEARRIEQWLATREVPQAPASFTATVMARVVHENWKTERAVDIGFNVAVAAGLAVIFMGGAGLGWSLGLFTITIDLEWLLRAGGGELQGRVINQVQTFTIAAALLTSALVLWWWAEASTE